MDGKPKIICVTGGKGGTGKTLCAVNIAVMFKNDGYKVLLIDGDVENPNTYLLLGEKLENKKEVHFFKPKIIENKREIIVIKKDSPKNCFIRSFFLAPTTFLNPTSFALFTAFAVLRFMKLMQAIIKTKNAINENITTDLISPPPPKLYRWIRVRGCRRSFSCIP